MVLELVSMTKESILIVTGVCLDSMYEWNQTVKPLKSGPINH